MVLNFNKILNGWKNYIDKSEVVEKVAEQRAEICGRCPFAQEKLLLIFVKDDFKEVEGMACTRCDCPLSMKIRSINENCPEKLW